MTDRYVYTSTNGRTPSLNNPARASMPSSIGYTSLYAGDMHVMPSSTRHPMTTTPRGYTISSTAAGTPTTTRTYAVNQDPRTRTSAAREGGRNRRSTVDSSARPPVIVTTTQKDRAHATGPTNNIPSASAHQLQNPRGSSPVRNSHRLSESQFAYAQPATTARPRSTAPYHRNTTDGDDYGRGRDRSDSFASRDAEAYRNARPSVMYPSDPRHSAAAINYGDEYQYTNAGELAKYDLDQTAVPTRTRNRRESLDRGYYRPNVSYNADQRSLNVNTSSDLSRNYGMNTSRTYDGRGGPPLTTRGFDKIDRNYDSSREHLPSAPIVQTSTRQGDAVAGSVERRPSRRSSRPVSLYQEGTPSSFHLDDLHRSREDERIMREARDREREPERPQELPYFQDENVTSRGFGIRTGPSETSPVEYRDHRRSDEDQSTRESGADRESKRRSRHEEKEERRERRKSRSGSDDDKGLRGKIASGVGIAAAAVGLNPGSKEEKEPRRRRSPTEDSSSTERPKDRAQSKDRSRRSSMIRDEAATKEQNRRDAEAKLSGDVVGSASESDETRKGSSSRRHRLSSAFNPNDAGDINKLREQLASIKTTDKTSEPEKEKPVIIERRASRSRSRSVSEARDSKTKLVSEEDSRGRKSVAPEADLSKQVRVVSPPKDKSDDKPLKGILKQPSAKFPEPTHFVREGAAPHREDKKTKDAPAGARWTKISRKVVNPEALTVGKERFEIRDDFVIVLRVLSKEEIQAYASATVVLRERRRARNAATTAAEVDRDDDRRRRSHRHGDDSSDEAEERDRRRRHHRKDEDDYEYER